METNLIRSDSEEQKEPMQINFAQYYTNLPGSQLRLDLGKKEKEMNVLFISNELDALDPSDEIQLKPNKENCSFLDNSLING